MCTSAVLAIVGITVCPSVCHALVLRQSNAS